MIEGVVFFCCFGGSLTGVYMNEQESEEYVSSNTVNRASLYQPPGEMDQLQ